MIRFYIRGLGVFRGFLGGLGVKGLRGLGFRVQGEGGSGV